MRILSYYFESYFFKFLINQLNFMNKDTFYKPIKFLLKDIGLSKSAINLGIKLSKKYNASLPIILWSYGLISLDELDRYYDYLWKN